MGTKVVLFVDDEKSILNSLKRGLIDEPYNKLFANSGKEALDILEKYQVHVLVTDMRMPEMTGLMLLRTVKENYPHVVRIVLSGYTQISTLMTAINQGEIYKYITKPWKLEKEFIPAIRQALEYYDIHSKNMEQMVVAIDAITHELRTPLCTFKNIISNALAGTMGDLSPKIKENLLIADAEISRLGRIIRDFMDISEIDQGKMKLIIKRFTIQSIVNKVLKSLTPLADAKNIQLAVSVPDDQISLDADYYRIVQVLNNLIDNAIKFTPEGGRIIVHIKNLDREIEVDVEDSGIGIPADEIGKVFTRFVQVEKVVGPGLHGTGLGLSITKSLIEIHGGRIWVESTVGRGSIFCFALPKCIEPSQQPEEILVNSCPAEV